MNLYWAGGLLVAFALWSGFMYHAGGASESHICGEADAQHDLAQQTITVAAQQHVITIQQKQSTISQEASDANAKSQFFINNMYASAIAGVRSTPAATGDNMRTIPQPAAGAGPSKVYHLTFQQCDSEEGKLNSLWNWANQQGALAAQ